MRRRSTKKPRTPDGGSGVSRRSRPASFCGPPAIRAPVRSGRAAGGLCQPACTPARQLVTAGPLARRGWKDRQRLRRGAASAALLDRRPVASANCHPSTRDDARAVAGRDGRAAQHPASPAMVTDSQSRWLGELPGHEIVRCAFGIDAEDCGDCRHRAATNSGSVLPVRQRPIGKVPHLTLRELAGRFPFLTVSWSRASPNAIKQKTGLGPTVSPPCFTGTEPPFFGLTAASSRPP